MILLNYRAGNHQMGKASHLLALAARAAYMLKLHREDPQLPFVIQESRRRLMWCIYTADRFNAEGVSVRIPPKPSEENAEVLMTN